MNNEKTNHRQVAELCNGTVIDHIPDNKLSAALRILHLEQYDNSSILVGYHLASNKMGFKSIIKVADQQFTPEQIGRLCIVAPNATLCIIKNYRVEKKIKMQLPYEIHNAIVCPNPKCITNNEPMPTHFIVTDRNRGIFKCRYCEKEILQHDKWKIKD